MSNLPKKVLGTIDELDINQLIELNHIIVARIKALRNHQISQDIEYFAIGDAVTFKYENKIISGIVIKINKKTVSVLTDKKEKWNITPHFLRKIQQAN